MVGRRDDHKPILAPRKGEKVGMTRQTFDPSGVAFELPNRGGYEFGVSDLHAEVSLRMPACEFADELGEHIVPDRQAGCDPDVHRLARAGFNLAHTVED